MRLFSIHMWAGVLGAALLGSSFCHATEFRGELGIQQRFFSQSPLQSDQPDWQTSVYAEPEWLIDLSGIGADFTFRPFLRWDSEDAERRSADIREGLLRWTRQDWDLSLGIGQVFWGQMESINPVDLINQRDYREEVDGKTKLGQPMVSLALWQSWGTTTFYVLPYFRERPYPGRDGRLRPMLPVLQDDPIYEDDDEARAIDGAVRWNHTLGNLDIGLSWFNGTTREPLLIPVITEGEPAGLQPYYPLLTQWGLDLLYIHNAWIWKLEAAYRDQQDEEFLTMVGGFERTLHAVLDSTADLGVLLEYQYDGRRNNTQILPQNDLFLGFRLAFNDTSGTEVLLGVTQDMDDDDARYGFIKSSRRINEHWTWDLKAWWFSTDQSSQPLYSFRRDDFVEFSVKYHF